MKMAGPNHHCRRRGSSVSLRAALVFFAGLVACLRRQQQVEAFHGGATMIRSTATPTLARGLIDEHYYYYCCYNYHHHQCGKRQKMSAVANHSSSVFHQCNHRHHHRRRDVEVVVTPLLAAASGANDEPEQLQQPRPRRKRVTLTMADVELQGKKELADQEEELLRQKQEKMIAKLKKKAAAAARSPEMRRTADEMRVQDDVEPKWYLLQVHTGMEKVCEQIINRKIDDWGMRERIERVVVPTRKAPQTRGKSVKVQDIPLYSGYVYFHCRMCQELRDLVGRLPHVSGFAGMKRDADNMIIPDTMPEDQMKTVFEHIESGDEEPAIMSVDLSIQDAVEITTGSYKGLTGILRVVRPDELLVRLYDNNRETDVYVPHNGCRKLSVEELEEMEAEKERKERASQSIEDIANERGVSVSGDRGRRDSQYGRFERDIERDRKRFMPKYQRLARAAATTGEEGGRLPAAADDIDVADDADAWSFLDEIVSPAPGYSDSSSASTRTTSPEEESGGSDDAFFASLMKELNAEYGIAEGSEEANLSKREERVVSKALPASDGSSFENLLSSLDEDNGDYGLKNDNTRGRADASPGPAPIGGSEGSDDIEDLLSALENADIGDEIGGISFLDSDKSRKKGMREGPKQQRRQDEAPDDFDIESILAELEAVDDGELESLLQELEEDELSSRGRTGARSGNSSGSAPEGGSDGDLDSLLASLSGGDGASPLVDLDSILLELESGSSSSPQATQTTLEISNFSSSSSSSRKEKKLTEAALKTMKVAELKQELSSRGLKVGGKKDELIARLLESES